MRALAAVLFVVATWAQAQDQTTGNIIYSTTNPAPPGVAYQWSGFITTESQGGGLSGGHVPGYNVPTGQFMFGYAQGTIAYSIAVNQALAGTGIQVSGLQYGLQYFNQDFSRGTLSTTVTLRGNGNNVLETYTHVLPQTTEGWTNFDQTRTFTNPYSLANVGTVSMSFTGQDDRFWAGYYGPQFRNQYLRLTYGVETCTTNPLLSPECPGYVAAYLTQQCTISALFNPACPGYAAAYLQQQCSINTLYDPACPGYQQAYFNYRCEQDGLYSTSCPNYGQAYARSQLLTTTTTTSAQTAATPAATSEPAATSTTSPTSVTSVTSVITLAPVVTSPAPAATTTTTTTTATESRQAERSVSSTTAGTSGAAARARAESRAKEVAAAAASAATLEAQAATQGLQIGLMAFVPGFYAYSAARIVDVNALAVQRQYGRQPVDNRSVLRQLSGASDRLHQDMVDQQWRP